MSRGLAALAPLILIPITLEYLGNQVYGLWMVIASLTSMALWADLGLGNGLLTKLAPCHAGGDWNTARRFVSTAYVTLALSAAGLICLLWTFSFLIPWGAIFGGSDTDLSTSGRMITLACFSAFLLNMPLSLVQRVQYAYQEVATSNMWQAAGSLASVGLTIGAVQLNLGAATVVVAATSGPILANIINSVVLYSTTKKRLTPRPCYVDREAIRELLQMGGKFFVLSIVTSLALNVDYLIIAHSLDLRAVTDYSVPARIFSVLGLLINAINLPLWPANGEALARRDYPWVRKTTTRMTVISIIGTAVPALALVALAGQGIAIWTGNKLASPQLILIALAMWWILLSAASPRFMLQNAAGLVRPQFYGWGVFLVVSLPLKWFAAKTLGISGLVLAGVLCYLLIIVPAAEVGYRKAISPLQPNDGLGQ